MHPFTTKNGLIINTVEELFEKLDTIDEDIFAEHVNGEKNDFASWVEFVVGDKFLSAAMRQATTKQDLKKVLFVHLYK